MSGSDVDCIALSSATSVNPGGEGPCCRTVSCSSSRMAQACRSCSQEEGAGRISLRQRIRRIIPQGVNSLYYADVSFSNVCNFKCRTCSSLLSTAWRKDDADLGRASFIKNEIGIEKLDYLSMKPLFYKFAGGEPFLAKSHIDFIKKLVEREDREKISLMYITNGSVRPNKEIKNLWEKFKKVTVVFSIDGPAKYNEYLRDGFDVGVFERNYEYFVSSLAISDVRCHMAISLYNLNLISQTLSYVDKFNFSDIKITVVRNPDFLSVLHLDRNLIETIMMQQQYQVPEKYLKIFEEVKIECIQSAVYNPSLIEHFFEFTRKLDSLRGQSFYLQNKDMADWVRFT